MPVLVKSGNVATSRTRKECRPQPFQQLMLFHPHATVTRVDPTASKLMFLLILVFVAFTELPIATANSFKVYNDFRRTPCSASSEKYAPYSSRPLVPLTRLLSFRPPLLYGVNDSRQAVRHSSRLSEVLPFLGTRRETPLNSNNVLRRGPLTIATSF